MKRKQEIVESKFLNDFLNRFSSDNTKRAYKCSIINFFEFMDKNPDTYIKDVRRMENDDKLNILDQYEKDLADFQNHLIKEKKAPKTIIGNMMALRVFFTHNRIQLDEMVWDGLRTRGLGNSVMIEDEVPTKQELQNILSHTDAKGRAMILALLSSGLRINELLQIKTKDIEMQLKENANPVRINVKPLGSKSKKSYVTFISDEAKQAIIEWLKVRDDYLVRSSAKTKMWKVLEDGRKINMSKSTVSEYLFPFTDDTARIVWVNMVTKARLNRKDDTGRFKLHIHSLRKYFRTNLGKFDNDLAENLMGHSGYLGDTYNRLTPDDKAEKYLKGVEHLYVFSTTTDLSGINESLQEKDKEIQKMKADWIENRLTIQELKQRITDMEAKIRNK